MTDTTQAARLMDEHTAFQAWARDQWGDRPVPDNAWLGWQARAALAAQAVPAGWRIRPQQEGFIVVHSPSGYSVKIHPEGFHIQERVLAELCAALAASPAPAEAKEEPLSQQFLREQVTKQMASVRAALATPQPQAAQPVAESEPMARFCPGCGSVGPVEAKYRDCCPDGSKARVIPEALANDCRELFRLALSAAVDGQANSAPALTEEQEREAFEEWAESEDFDLSISWGNQQYTDGATLLAWGAWKARAALRLTQGGE